LRESVERLLATRQHVGGSTRVEGPGGGLEMGIIARYRENEVLIRIVEQDPLEEVSRLRERLQLTAREAEVLLWLSYGKSNADISEVLKISPRTVQKHLERIYEKLGVETRSAAATVALRVTGK
jgi:DNA-binding CsgD family transcriptional regulator